MRVTLRRFKLSSPGLESSRLRPDTVVRHYCAGNQYVLDVNVESSLSVHVVARAACQLGYAAVDAEHGSEPNIAIG